MELFAHSLVISLHLCTLHDDNIPLSINEESDFWTIANDRYMAEIEGECIPVAALPFLVRVFAEKAEVHISS